MFSEELFLRRINTRYGRSSKRQGISKECKREPEEDRWINSVSSQGTREQGEIEDIQKYWEEE